jgi:hypothetical protein
MARIRSCALAAWGNAWLVGAAGLDDVTAEVTGPDAPHELAGETLALGLATLRRVGARRLRSLLPTPGDASGLPGPLETNQATLGAGEAVLVLCGDAPPLVLVPKVTVHGPDGDQLESVSWQVLDGARIPPPPASVRAAEHELAEAVREATTALLRLDVAGGDTGPLAALRAGGDEAPAKLPPGYPGAAHALLARAGRLGALLDVAAAQVGAAVSSGEIRARDQVLRQLAGVVRRAQESALDAFAPEHTQLGSH